MTDIEIIDFLLNHEKTNNQVAIDKGVIFSTMSAPMLPNHKIDIEQTTYIINDIAQKTQRYIRLGLSKDIKNQFNIFIKRNEKQG